MFVTTSRDPSARTRRFARALAGYLSVPYVNRGKQRPDEMMHSLVGEDSGTGVCFVVVEDHGNPAGVIKHSIAHPDSEDVRLSFRLVGEPQGRRYKRCTPKVRGDEGAAGRIAGFFEVEEISGSDPGDNPRDNPSKAPRDDSSDKPRKEPFKDFARIILAARDCVDFTDEGSVLFRLKIT